MRTIWSFGPVRRVLLAAFGVVALFAQPAAACLWDSDTLRTEAKGLPGVAEAVTGFFDRYPDVYYERRLEIVADRLAANPDELEAFDDAAVACDRLGRHDEALAWLARKREVMDGLAVRSRVERETLETHEYRYHANLGTVYAHQWIKGGADAQDTSDLELARANIARAIEINPDAHFGRERYQLAAIRWLLSPDAADRCEHDDLGLDPHLPLFLAHLSGTQGDDVSSGSHVAFSEDTIEALVGLIVLGAAWESVDVFHTLGTVLGRQRHASLALLARLRADELRAQGRDSLHPDLAGVDPASIYGLHRFGSALYPSNAANTERWFSRARRAADAQRAERSAWIEAKIAAGEHPDTHPAFWDGVPEYGMPRMPAGVMFAGRDLKWPIVGGVVVLSLLAALRLYKARRRQAGMQAAA